MSAKLFASLGAKRLTRSTDWAKEEYKKQESECSPDSFCVGYDLSSRLVSKQVLSARQSLTSVFGMGTGGPFALE